MFNINFPFLLLFLIFASGLIWFADHFLFAKNRSSDTKLPVLVDYSKSLFWVFVLVFVLRSFVAQLFVVPSGSLEPTVKPGDFLFVTQYSYGIRMPLWDKLLIPTGKPKVGDIAVVHWPVNTRADFVKRVVAVPGDTVSYINKVFYINGKKMPQKFIKSTYYSDPGLPKWKVNEMQEDLMGVKHMIYLCPETSTQCPGHKAQNFYNLKVPKSEYLLIGDNRDDSDDSRYWGFVPAKDLVGKARFIIFSWDSNASLLHKINWSRIGTKL